MSKKQPPYAPEYRRQMVELVRAGLRGAARQTQRPAVDPNATAPRRAPNPARRQAARALRLNEGHTAFGNALVSGHQQGCPSA